jgi:hypothetical protein
MRVPSSLCALCTPERRAGAAPGRPRLLVGRAGRPPFLAGQAARRVSQVKRFITMVGPQQVERALCMWAELGFGREAV